MEINKNKENQHCGTKPKKIAFGIAPLGIVSIGIVPMGVISIGVVPMGVFSFGAVAMGIVNLSVVGMGIISAGVTTMGIWEYSPNSQNNHHNFQNFPFYCKITYFFAEVLLKIGDFQTDKIEVLRQMT